MKFNNLSAVILAGGTNSRFGGIIKANYVIEGKTIISGIINTVKSIFPEIIIVTNTPEEFSDYKSYKIIGDQFSNVGPLGGIHAGMRESAKEAVFVFAGDMPLLDKQVISKQIEFYIDNPCDIVIPAVGKNIEPLHSIYNILILSKLESFLSSGNNYATRDFFNLVDARYLKFEDSEVTGCPFANINSPSDIPFVEEKLRIKPH